VGWTKLCDTAHKNRKLNQLSHEAHRVYMKGLSLCGATLSDGRLSREEGSALCFEVAMMHGGDPTRWEQILEELTMPPEGFENPFWHRKGDGSFQVHDYGEYNPPAVGTQRTRNRRKLVMRLSRMGIDASTVIDPERLEELPTELQVLFRPVAGGFCFGKSAGRPPKGAEAAVNRHEKDHGPLHEKDHGGSKNRHGPVNRHVTGHEKRHVPPSRTRTRSRSRPPSPKGGLGGAAPAVQRVREALAVLFAQAREPDLALAERWSADCLDPHDCLAVVAHLMARQLARGEPMESLAYADRRIRGEGLPTDIPEKDVLGFGAMRYQMGFPTPVDPEAESYARRVYDFDARLGSWAFWGLTRGQNQVSNRKERKPAHQPAKGRKPPITLVPPKEASS